MKAELSFSGIFLITAASGFRQPTYYSVKSFKIWDTKTEVLNTRFQDSHLQKAMSEHLADVISANIDDLIHKKGGQDATLTLEEYVEKIRHLDYLIHNSLDKTDNGLALVASHFG